MPYIDGSDLKPLSWYGSAHYNTIFPYFFSPTPKVAYERERLRLQDGDFLDVDHCLTGHKKAVLLLHGLEGSSRSKYILDFAEYFSNNGWDVIAPCYRGCSGVDNLSVKMYNSGTTEDINEVIQQYAPRYDMINIIGFSLGGNILLKYLGKKDHGLPANLGSCIAVSTPVHLSDASQRLLAKDNFLYQLNFLRSLIAKVVRKKRKHPDQLSLKNLWKTYNLYRFDHYFTAPIYGYRDAEEYYEKNQSIQWLDQITTPTLLINAKDDPFLGPKCYPYDIAESSKSLYLCFPQYGGHVGFFRSLKDREWIYDKAIDFINSQSKI